MGQNQDADDSDFADDSEDDSRQAIETQKRILKQWQTMLTGSKYLFSNWAEMNRRFFDRAVKRLSDVQAEPDPGKQTKMMGTVATENVNDYVEHLGELAHEWNKVGQKLMRAGVTAAVRAARDSAHDERKAREAYDEFPQSSRESEGDGHGKSDRIDEKSKRRRK